MKFLPSLDKGFKPIIIEYRDFLKSVQASGKISVIGVCVERNNGYNYVFETEAYRDGVNDDENYRIIERVVKAVLWMAGGYKIYVKGSRVFAERLKKAYSVSGNRAFDSDFMSTCYLKDFEVVYTESLPKTVSSPVRLGGFSNGCRIGFDAGGSDFKICAVKDGKEIFSEEIVWNPKTQDSPDYHYEMIEKGLKKASSKLDKVDAIGVSSAGVIIDNKLMVSSLFLGVDKSKYLEKCQNAFVNVIEMVFPSVPYAVANDGDITALAGSMSLNLKSVMGLAMGTSEAVGYINEKGDINGWISELAFCPVDLNENAPVDEWSGDKGVGCKYFSQDAVIRLYENSGKKFNDKLTKAEKLSFVQSLLEQGDETAYEIYENIGVFLGYTLPFYHMFYKMENLLLMGRVVSGKAGTIIVNRAEEVLKEEFGLKINIILPDEKAKRVGQSIASASLVEIK